MKKHFNVTPFLKAYAKKRYKNLLNQDYQQTQLNQLLKLINYSKDTQFGKDHNFSSINSIEEYQKNVPLRYYEDFWDQYWKESYPVLNNLTYPGTIPYLPVSSGTTSGVTKHIPLTKDMLKSNNKAGTDLLCYHILNNPNSKILSGKSFFLGGSTSLVKKADNIFSGDLSGISTINLPFWARLRYFPGKELALLSDWEEKIDKLAKASLKENITMISGVPSWLLIFFEKLFTLKPEARGDISKVYPNLEMLIHGGVNFEPYKEQFEDLFGEDKTKIQTREVYPATEGFIATADRNYGQGLRMNLDHGIFYEFVPLEELDSKNPTRHWIGNIEKDVNYAIILTTCSGLWSYIIGDTVKFIETSPPRILITGRTSYYLSAFGEHLIPEEIEDAISTAAKSINKRVVDYSCGPVYPKDSSELGGHLFYVEFNDEINSKELINKFEVELDSKLCTRNEDYEAHRASGYGLKQPKLAVCKPGFFSDWMKERGKLGGQNKVPRVIMKKDLFENLNTYYNKY